VLVTIGTTDETASAVDTSSPALVTAGTISESASAADTVTAPGGATYDETLAETASATDSPDATGGTVAQPGGGGGAYSPARRKRQAREYLKVTRPRYRVLTHEEIYGPPQPRRIKALRSETAPAALLLGAAEAALPRFDATSLQALRDTASPDLIEAIKAAALAAAATAAEQEQRRRDEQERIAAEVARVQAEALAAAAEALAADDAEAIALIMQVEEEVVQAFLEAISSLVPA
jgi:hypothetical protein